MITPQTCLTSCTQSTWSTFSLNFATQDEGLLFLEVLLFLFMSVLLFSVAGYVGFYLLNVWLSLQAENIFFLQGSGDQTTFPSCCVTSFCSLMKHNIQSFSCESFWGIKVIISHCLVLKVVKYDKLPSKWS